MDEQIYQPPALTELGEFSDDTLGSDAYILPDTTEGSGFPV
jgi:hypothetical protein